MSDEAKHLCDAILREQRGQGYDEKQAVWTGIGTLAALAAMTVSEDKSTRDYGHAEIRRLISAAAGDKK